MLGISEIAILLIVVTLILGAKKLPELARSLGKSARILKSEAKAMKSDGAPPAGGVTTSQEVTTPTRIVPGNAGDRTG
ncbi:Sec-independent protein translocase subunit TatA [Streptomyces sp. M10(2022)]